MLRVGWQQFEEPIRVNLLRNGLKNLQTLEDNPTLAVLGSNNMTGQRRTAFVCPGENALSIVNPARQTRPTTIVSKLWSANRLNFHGAWRRHLRRASLARTNDARIKQRRNPASSA